MSASLSVELVASLDRCAQAVGTPERLKGEVAQLKATGEGLAHFAAMLFELELAREGDVEVRGSLGQLSEMLLVFWRDGSGEAFARLHPALHSLWDSIAPLLVQFELRQFERHLQVLWDARADPPALKEALAALRPPGNPRVEFATCVYHLELARQGVDSSRAEFARRAGLLAQAYQDAEYAAELVGDDAGLTFLWTELLPYLDEFFEGLEEQAQRALDDTKRVKTADLEAPTPPATPALGDDEHKVPSFRTLTRAAPGEPEPAPEVFEGELPDGPPPPPRPSVEQELELIEVVESDGPPPPPLVTPSHGVPAATAELLDEVDLLDEAPPPLPDDVSLLEEDDVEPDPRTLAFWDYTFASLQLAPAEGLRSRMLATETRADRKRLTTWLDGLTPHDQVPEAQAFAALVRLLLAGETKEKSLFGQPNPRRREALSQAFSLLSGDVRAAGHVAVWFELDGPETRAALNRGLELLVPFLGWCARTGADPTHAASISKYLEK